MGSKPEGGIPVWSQLLADWTLWMRASGKPESTIYLRTYHLRRFAKAHSNPFCLGVSDLAEWLGSFAWGAETLRSYRASLRAFYSWALAAGLCASSPAAALPTVTARVGKPRPAPEDVLAEAVRGSDRRVRLMLRLGAHAGLRRAEIAAVHSHDVFEDLDGWSLRVKGKGDRTRLVPLTRWLALEVRSVPTGWVFPSPTGGHLSPAHVGKLMSEALGPGWTAHTLRHRFATRAYAVERDLRAVQELLGHSKPETTAIYTQVPLGAKRRAIDLIA
jgi:integrase